MFQFVSYGLRLYHCILCIMILSNDWDPKQQCLLLFSGCPPVCVFNLLLHEKRKLVVGSGFPPLSVRTNRDWWNVAVPGAVAGGMCWKARTFVRSGRDAKAKDPLELRKVQCGWCALSVSTWFDLTFASEHHGQQIDSMIPLWSTCVRIMAAHVSKQISVGPWTDMDSWTDTFNFNHSFGPSFFQPNKKVRWLVWG